VKLFVIGLDCAAPALLFGDERLVHVRRLMDGGCYGRLESVVPPITIPAWRCMATSQDPGSLGVYGFRNRADRSYGRLETVTSRSFRAPTIWDYLAMEGRRSVLIGVPPSFPPPRVNGIAVGCFMTPSVDEPYTHPPEVAAEIAALVGEYMVDVKGFRTDDKAWLRDQLFEMSRRQFAVVRHYAARGTGTTSSSSTSRSTACSTASGGTWTRRTPTTSRVAVRDGDRRLLPPPRRRDRRPAGAARRRHGRCSW
jgi:predicted AlkP superfamily phosphohydrolase/phosphomutase